MNIRKIVEHRKTSDQMDFFHFQHCHEENESNIANESKEMKWMKSFTVNFVVKKIIAFGSYDDSCCHITVMNII